jgi:hypothetical protein
MNGKSTSETDLDRVYLSLKNEAEDGGYRFNPDVEFTKKPDPRSPEKRAALRVPGLSLPACIREKGGRSGYNLPVRLPGP